MVYLIVCCFLHEENQGDYVYKETTFLAESAMIAFFLIPAADQSRCIQHRTCDQKYAGTYCTGMGGIQHSSGIQQSGVVHQLTQQGR